MYGLTSDEVDVIEKLQAEPPWDVGQVKPEQTAALARLYEGIHKNPSTDEYVFLCQLRDGKVELNASTLHSTWLPTFYKLMERFGTTKDMRLRMRQAVGNLAGGTATIYRDCSAEEATSAQSSGKLEQSAEHSFDKYKWLFVDLSTPPIQSKDPPYRLTITAKGGIVKLLSDLAVQHVGGVDSPVVSRCYQRLRDKGITPDEGVPNEVGSFAVHQDVLDLFNTAINSITKAAKRK